MVAWSVLATRIHISYHVRCYTHKYNQLMGNLPQDRVTPNPPFSHSGVDYAGPYPLRQLKCRDPETKDGYIWLFVCFLARTIHLEAVEDLTSEAFIATFHRFTARRDHCSHLKCENGTNFVVDDSMLLDMFNESSEFVKEVRTALAPLGTSWDSKPAYRPSFLWLLEVKY